MSSYPPPPSPGQPSYNSLYQDNPFAALNQHIYAKDDSPAHSQSQGQDQSGLPNDNSHKIQQALAQELQHHNVLNGQQPQVQHVSAQSSQPNGAAMQMAMAQQHQMATDIAQKVNRLRKACDSCSIRKVKCDESGPPCRACASLDIPCTFDRPSRRRGPPNRHAEAMKRRKLDNSGSDASPGFSNSPPPPSPSNVAHGSTSQLLTPAIPVTADSICSVGILDLLVDDFFTYVHPMCPFPHEPSFREAWKRREDLTNPSFLALLSAMIGCLVASYPRKPRLFLRSQERYLDFPDHIIMVQRCQKVCLAARGPAYLISENLNVHDAATSFFLGQIGTYLLDWRMSRLYLSECLTILQTLRLNQASSQVSKSPMSLMEDNDTFAELSSERSFDNITLEMGRRVFWTLYVTIQSLEQQGIHLNERAMFLSFSPATSPDLPTEVEDFCIYPSHNDPQPPDFYLPVTTGFNVNVKLYTSSNQMLSMERAMECDFSVDWQQQKQILHQTWQKCQMQYKIDLGSPLHVYPGLEVDNYDGHYNPSAPQPHLPHDPAQLLSDPTLRMQNGDVSNRRRDIMLAMQRGNIYVSYLALRTHIAEKFWSLFESSGRIRPPHSELKASQHANDAATKQAADYDVVERAMSEAQEENVLLILGLLGRIDRVNLEPNGDLYTTRLRCIARSMLDIPDRRKSKTALRAQTAIRTFLRLLIHLEHSDAQSDSLRDHLDTDTRPGHADQNFSDFTSGATGMIRDALGDTHPARSAAESRWWAEMSDCQETLLKLSRGESGNADLEG